MAYEKSTIPGVGTQGSAGLNANENLIKKFRQLMTGRAWLQESGYTGTGDGTLTDLDSDIAAPTETWTLTCTDDTTSGAEVFSVTGSVSGAQTSATVGVAYDDIIQFTLNAGATDFVVGDEFTVAATASPIPSSERWTQLLWDPDNNFEFAAEGPNLSGFDQVYVGFYATQEVSPGDWYNIHFRIGTGWIPGSTTLASGLTQYTTFSNLCWQFDIPYWIAVHDRRIAWGLDIENIMEGGYLGLYLTYQDPSDYPNGMPYPACGFGTVAGESQLRYSDTSRYIGCMGPSSTKAQHWNPASGVWSNTDTWPYMQNPDFDHGWVFDDGAALEPVENLSAVDVRAALPIMLSDSSPGILGEYDGIFYVSGFALSQQDIITIDSTDYIVVRNIQRTGFNDYLAIREN